MQAPGWLPGHWSRVTGEVRSAERRRQHCAPRLVCRAPPPPPPPPARPFGGTILGASVRRPARRRRRRRRRRRYLPGRSRQVRSMGQIDAQPRPTVDHGCPMYGSLTVATCPGVRGGRGFQELGPAAVHFQPASDRTGNERNGARLVTTVL